MAVLAEAERTAKHYDRILRRYGIEKEPELFAAFGAAARDMPVPELDAVLAEIERTID